MPAELAHVLADVMGDGEFSREMTRFAKAFAAYRERLPVVPRAYSRTRLAIAPEYEIVAMNWAPLSVSPIHDHGTSRCWVLMLEGALDVQNYACDPDEINADVVRLRESERMGLRAGDVDHRLAPTELHLVRNPSATDSAFSLQLYARPLGTYSVVDARSFRRRLIIPVLELDLSNEPTKSPA